MMVPAWEYRVEERRTTADVAWLNALGQEGWEAVQSLPLHDAMGNSLPQVGHIWLFKRMVIDHPMIVQPQESAGLETTNEVVADAHELQAMQEQPRRRHQMSEENRQKARERMQAMVAARKANRHAVQEPEAQEADHEPAIP